MNTGILGGTFNPVHLGHLRMAEEMREALGLRQVLFLPAAVPPLKHGDIAAPADRLEMVRLAVAQNPSFELSDRELLRAGPSYTVDTLRELKQGQPPGSRLWFLLGSDTVPDLHRWREPAALFELASFAVALRPGTRAKAPRELLPEQLAADFEDGPDAEADGGLVHRSGNELRLVPTTALAISASDIRRRVARGASIRYLVPAAVADYIAKHTLYQESI